MGRYNQGKSASGTINECVYYGYKAYYLRYRASYSYTPAVMYLKNGDPGYPKESESDYELDTINGWPADEYLKKLAFWNKAAYDMIIDHEPDFDNMDEDEPDFDHGDDEDMDL
jgi:hypothetical protein